MVPLDFTEDDVTWVASKLSVAAGALGTGTIEMKYWLIRFGCVPEELGVIVTKLADCMSNFSPPGLPIAP